MTAVAISLRHRVPRRAAVPFAAAGRLLRLELRRNVMIWVLPLLGALFWFDAYRTAMSYPAVWDLRASVIPDKVMIDFATFVAGASAWMGSRETRRHATDLVTTTGRPGWARLSATLAATLAWVMAGYLACVAVLYGATAAQATWGAPPWWPVAVGAAALAAVCAAGFTAGASFANRFVPWLAPGQNSPETGDLAQQAVETVLLRQVAPELTNDTLGPPVTAAAVAAISRFAALSPAARHAWLAAHLNALRAGRVSLGQLP